MHQESKCAICFEMRNDYSTLSCSHQLCNECYENLIQNAMKAKNHVSCPFCREVQYPCCKSYLLSTTPSSSTSPSSPSRQPRQPSRAQEDVYLTVRHDVCETYEKKKQPMFLKFVGFLVMCACLAIAIYAIVNVTQKN